MMVDETFHLEQIDAPYFLSQPPACEDDPAECEPADHVLDDTFTSTSESLSDPASINTSLVMGDFLRVIDLLLSLISFQYFVQVLQVFPLPDTFIIFMRVVGGLVAVMTLIYVISGRATKGGP